MAALTSPSCPGVISNAMGLPHPSTTAWIYVVRPPRERPIACVCSPLFRLLRSGALWLRCCRSSAHHLASPAPERQTAFATHPDQTNGGTDYRLLLAARRSPDNPASGIQI